VQSGAAGGRELRRRENKARLAVFGSMMAGALVVFAALAANTQKFAACGELRGVCKREPGKALPANPETPEQFFFILCS